MVRRPPGMEMALLGYLRQGPIHGYQLHQLVNDPDGLGPIWNLKQSQLYALLSKLEQDAYIQSEVEAQEPARPPRKILHLTPVGKTAFEQWMRSPVRSHYMMRQEFLAKIYFARQEGTKPIRTLVNVQRALCQQWLDSLSAEAVEPNSFPWVLRQYRVGQIQADLDWLENQIKED
ncbi:MAG: PadR family transcriptional regulator [Chloroflexi bacterium]|nr:PadR family transcriptional regulator [Chloroflexota bacterium]